jgi:hypothetical protein
MSGKRVIKVRVGSEILFFAIWDLLLGESVVGAGLRMDTGLVYFANATHLDIILRYFRERKINLKGWKTLFGVGAQCRMQSCEQDTDVFTVWGLNVKRKDITPYDETVRPGPSCGILMLLGSKPVSS